jgi:hypothetical protein
MSYRKVPAGQAGGFLFTYALRFVDGRGETVEERFEVVFVGIDGQISQDSQADLQRFVQPSALRSGPNLTPEEEAELLPAYKSAFERARAQADQETAHRQGARAAELAHQQDAIAEEALIRLGRWKQASEDRLRRRFDDLHDVRQYDLFGVVSRRLARFRKEQGDLLKQETARREEIRAMKRVRGDTVDAIGALVMIPEALA